MTKEERETIESEQEKFFNNIQISDLTGYEIIKHFIESENIARKYQFQGKFFPGAYFEIKKLVKTTMKDVPEEMRVKTFYYLILFDYFFPINKKNYPFYLEAVQFAMPVLYGDDEYTYRFTRYHLFLLFGISGKEAETGILEKNSYEEFESIRRFIDKAKSYSAYPYMRKKKDKLRPFLDNEILMNRIREGFCRFEDFNFVTAASLLLLLMDDREESKNRLFEKQEKDLSRGIVWLLGSFYKDFQGTEENTKLLEDLYSKYPENWVDKYKTSI